MKKKLMIGLLAIITATPAAAEGVLDFSSLGEFVYERLVHGKIAYVGYLGGDRSVAAYTDIRTFHSSKKKAKERGENLKNFAALSVGAQVDVKNRAVVDPFFSTPINLIEVSRLIWGSKWAQNHSTGMSLPNSLELWAGPVSRFPTKNWTEWTFRSHFGGFISLGKRFGGVTKAGDDQ